MKITLILYALYVANNGNSVNITLYTNKNYTSIEQCLSDGINNIENYYQIYYAGDSEYTPNGFKCVVTTKNKQ